MTRLPRPPRPLGFLVWIVIYKSIKVTLALTGGILALRLMHHHDLTGDVTRWLLRFGFDPEGRIGARILGNIGAIPKQLDWVACLLFFYAVLYTIEGVGLYLEKRWAEWFTVFQTSLIIPPEIYAIVRHPNVLTFVVFGTSITTVVYLLWRIRYDRRQERLEQRAAALSLETA